jgi:cyanophycinase
MLALVGSGEYLPPIEPVDRFLLEHLPGAPRVACLPTAAGAEGHERIAYWSNLGLQYFTGLGVQVESLPVIDRQSANDPQLVERMLLANYIYLSGGRPDYLLDTLKSSLAWQAIQDILARGGLLAGCSAGAMILGERVLAFPGWRKAFNLIPGAVIMPHFEEIPERFTKVLKFLVGKGSTLIGIEGSTALFINQGKNEVVGMGSVTIWNQSGKVQYTSGQEVPFPVT